MANNFKVRVQVELVECNDPVMAEPMAQAPGRFELVLEESTASSIPCDAVRRHLGLRNSSNVGEKANDLIVSDRQKHNGMSWSRCGSVALAAITALVRNQEYKQWFQTGTVAFAFAA